MTAFFNPPALPSAVALSRIVLTGFMGAGKSTLGPILAARLGWRFVDVDQTLLHAHAASIAELFEKLGEPGFRELEEKAIRELLLEERIVLALGGGALESESTRACLLHGWGTHLVFLETPLDVALARCAQQADGVVRPVLRDTDRPALMERYARRLEQYRKAHRTIVTVDRTPTELAEVLLEALALQ